MPFSAIQRKSKAMKLKAAIYCRLSEEDRDKPMKTADSESIQNQKSMLLDYARAQGWEVYGIYSDDDYTGADRQRPAFNRLLQDAKHHQFDIILCKTQSRFTRELELVEKYIHGLFPLWGVRFVSIVDNADTANKGNKKARQINGLVNEWYLEDMSENIRSVLTNKRQNGLHIGSFALYGYQKDPKQKGHLIIDREAAEIVRQVFTLFSQGYGKTAIARILNEHKIPNPTEYKRLHGLRYQQPKQKNSTLWTYSAIANMLANEIYIGNMVQGKYGSVSYKTKQNKPRPKQEWFRVEGTHEPIIDPELWSQVQTLRAQRTKPCAVGTIGLFAGKTRCAHCGYTMRSSKNHGRHYLRCAIRYAAKDACIGSFISVEQLQQRVTDEWNRLAAAYLDPTKLAQNISVCNCLQTQKQRLLSDQAACEKKIADYKKAVRELYMDKAKGLISESDFAELWDHFSREQQRLQTALVNIQRQFNENETRSKADNSRIEILKAYVPYKRLDRAAVEILIDYISVDKRTSGMKEAPITIHWNF